MNEGHHALRPQAGPFHARLQRHGEEPCRTGVRCHASRADVDRLQKAYVGKSPASSTYKLDYANRQACGGGGAASRSTRIRAAANYYPVAVVHGTTGEVSNVDNRFQTVTVSSTTSVAAGDAFTIAAVDAVHHITKQRHRANSRPSGSSAVPSHHTGDFAAHHFQPGRHGRRRRSTELRGQYRRVQQRACVPEHRGGADQPLLAEGRNRAAARPLRGADRCARGCIAVMRAMKTNRPG
jgi:hypothetical protein